jgi:hypothetical protein
LSDGPREFLVADEVRDGLTGFLEAGKVPQVREITALLRLHRLHGAILAFQKNALATRFFLKHKSAPVVAQSCEMLDEFVFTDALKRGEPGDFFIRQAHLTRPATAGGATLTFIKNRHARRLSEAEAGQK